MTTPIFSMQFKAFWCWIFTVAQKPHLWATSSRPRCVCVWLIRLFSQFRVFRDYSEFLFATTQAQPFKYNNGYNVSLLAYVDSRRIKVVDINREPLSLISFPFAFTIKSSWKDFHALLAFLSSWCTFLASRVQC